MLNISRKPIVIPPKIQIEDSDGVITAIGPLGRLHLNVNEKVEVKILEGKIFVSGDRNSKVSRALIGTTTVLLKNLIVGVSEGFKRELKLVGVGFRAKAEQGKLELNIGFSVPVTFNYPPEVTLELPTPADIVVKGIDKQIVTQTAAKIRAIRSPEPYQGKGIRYADEVVILRKAKKTK